MSTNKVFRAFKWTFHHLWVVTGAFMFTLGFFLVLPLMQTIAHPPASAVTISKIDSVIEPPPPPPPPEEEKKEEEPEPPPPELQEEPQQIDLQALEMALNPTLGDGWFSAETAVNLNAAAAESESLGALFSLDDLDQQPRVIYQPSPNLTAQLRKKAPGTVYIIFIVDERGKVDSPIVQSSTDPIFEAPALAAIKQWKFEPGKRQGNPVRFRMRIPITFPKGN